MDGVKRHSRQDSMCGHALHFLQLLGDFRADVSPVPCGAAVEVVGNSEDEIYTHREEEKEVERRASLVCLYRQVSLISDRLPFVCACPLYVKVSPVVPVRNIWLSVLLLVHFAVIPGMLVASPLMVTSVVSTRNWWWFTRAGFSLSYRPRLTVSSGPSVPTLLGSDLTTEVRNRTKTIHQNLLLRHKLIASRPVDCTILSFSWRFFRPRTN